MLTKYKNEQNFDHFEFPVGLSSVSTWGDLKCKDTLSPATINLYHTLVHDWNSYVIQPGMVQLLGSD